MKKYDLLWTDTDARFVEALLLATGGEGGASLQDVLLMADALDGTVFSFSEVEDALEKLAAVQIVTLQKNKLSLSQEFLQMYEAITVQEGLTDNNSPLLNLLQQQQPSEQQINAAREGALKKYKLKNYYQQYQEQFG